MSTQHVSLSDQHVSGIKDCSAVFFCMLRCYELTRMQWTHVYHSVMSHIQFGLRLLKPCRFFRKANMQHLVVMQASRPPASADRRTL